MNLYDFFHRLVEKGPFTETEQRDYHAVIKNAEDMNALGAVVREDIRGHECKPNTTRPLYGPPKCIYCGRSM